MEKTLKAVLFDLDGVLVDTEGIYTEFWAGIDKIHPTGVENFALVIKGNTLVNILNTYFPSPSVQADIIRMLEEHELTMPYVLMDGAMELLVDLKDKGILVAIVTSSSPRKMSNLFSQIPHLKDFIDTIVTDADVEHGKPNPEGYLLAASRLGAAPEQCIVVEDSLAGLEAGRRSGARVLGLATTNPESKLVGHADFIAPCIAQINLQTLFQIMSLA